MCSYSHDYVNAGFKVKKIMVYTSTVVVMEILNIIISDGDDDDIEYFYHC